MVSGQEEKGEGIGPQVRGTLRDKKGWTSRVGLANRLPQKDKW